MSNLCFNATSCLTLWPRCKGKSSCRIYLFVIPSQAPILIAFRSLQKCLLIFVSGCFSSYQQEHNQLPPFHFWRQRSVHHSLPTYLHTACHHLTHCISACCSVLLSISPSQNVSNTRSWSWFLLIVVSHCLQYLDCLGFLQQPPN